MPIKRDPERAGAATPDSPPPTRPRGAWVGRQAPAGDHGIGTAPRERAEASHLKRSSATLGQCRGPASAREEEPRDGKQDWGLPSLGRTFKAG